MNYANNKQKKVLSTKSSIRHISDAISNNIDNNNQWRNSCHINQREISIKHEQQPYLSYKVNIFSRIKIFYLIIFLRLKVKIIYYIQFK